MANKVQKQIKQNIMEESKDGLVKSLKPQQLKQIVLQNQNQEQKGYYTKQEWGTLHQSLLGVQRTILPVLNTWRLLKLINFGDDFVPTGLVYDTLITLLDQEKPTEQTQALIKSIFFKFIEFNGKSLSDKQQQELAFFRVIRSVVEGYRQILSGDIEPLEINDKFQRHQQLYRLHNVFTYRKNLQALKKIDQQFKNCKFQPQLNPKIQLIQSRYLEPKVNYQLKNQQQKHTFNAIIDEQDQYNQGFRAQPVPYYPEVTPIGLNQHLVRMQKSRQIKRITNLKPSHNVSNGSDIGPFSLNQRTQARKQKMLNNFKLLFFIKVEVGKRIYRVKVRQNMSVDDVVKTIELMVGFRDQSLPQIVKNYFVNYQNRQKQRSTIYQEY